MRSILRLVRPSPTLWGQVCPAGAVVWVWSDRVIRVWPVPLGVAIALTMYAAGA